MTLSGDSPGEVGWIGIDLYTLWDILFMQLIPKCSGLRYCFLKCALTKAPSTGLSSYFFENHKHGIYSFSP